MITHIVQRHMVRRACEKALTQTSMIRTSSHIKNEITLEVIEVIARHMTANSHHDFTQRKAFFSLVKKVKKILEIFKKAPQAWTKFKEMLGVTSNNPIMLVKQIDKKLGELLEEGKKKLANVAKNVLKELPILRLLGEVLDEKNTWERLIDNAIKKLPTSVLNAFSAIEKGASKLGDFLDEILSKSKVLKALSVPVKIYIFFQIWDWFADFNFKAVVSGLLGSISFSDLVSMLPGEGIEIILELVLPPPANGALAKLVIGAGISTTWAVILVYEIKHLMWFYKVSTTKELLEILENN